MQKLLLHLFLVAVVLVVGMSPVRGQAPGWAWATSPGLGYGTNSAADAAGNLYVTGGFIGTATFGATTLTSVGEADIFVVKLASDGTYLWAVQAGGGGFDTPNELVLDASGNVYVAGGFTSRSAVFGGATIGNSGADSTSNVFVAKLNSAGAWQWAVGAGGDTSEFAEGLSIDSADHLFVAGVSRSPLVTFGNISFVGTGGPENLFAAKLTPGGVWQWAQPVGTASNITVYNLTVSGVGELYLSGSFYNSDANFGSTMLAAKGGPDAFLVKLDSTGAHQWAVSAGGSGFDVGHAVAVDISGQVILAGVFSDSVSFGTHRLISRGNADLFVARLSVSGAWQRVAQAGGLGQEILREVVLTTAGDCYLTGFFGSPSASFGAHTVSSAGSYDAFVAKLNTANTWEWAVGAGGVAFDQCNTLTVGASGEVYVAGGFGSPTITFGNTTLTATGGGLFIARLNQPALGLPNVSPTTFTLAPNPAHRSVRLTGTLAPTATLLNALGRAVRTWPLTASADLDLTGIPAGL